MAAYICVIWNHQILVVSDIVNHTYPHYGESKKKLVKIKNEEVRKRRLRMEFENDG